MKSVRIEPSIDHPMPYHLKDDVADSFLSELDITSATTDLIEGLDAPIELDEAGAKQAAELIEQAVRFRKTDKLTTPESCFAAREFLRTYSARLAVEAADIRVALTNKLLELANCGDPKYELKAIELLGKHSDIGLFTERSQVTVTHRTADSLEEAIKDKIKRLMSADIIDVTPITTESLMDELGPVDIKDK